MTKKKTGIIIGVIAGAACIGAAVYCNYANAKLASKEAMLAEMNGITAEIADAEDAVIVEYGADTIDLWSAVFKAKQEHPDFYIDYTVDGETELAAFSTKDVGEHVIAYTVSAEDACINSL